MSCDGTFQGVAHGYDDCPRGHTCGPIGRKAGEPVEEREPFPLVTPFYVPGSPPEPVLPRVGVGVPLVSMPAPSVISLCRLLIETRAARTDLLVVQGAYIQHNRGILVKLARQQGCTHLFYMDHDMVFPGDTIDTLLAHDRPIVGVTYNMRGVEPPSTCVVLHDERGEKTPWERLPKEPFRCHALPGGGMLVRMDVFDKIPRPWFAIEEDDDGELTQSEDVWFCNRARAAGFEIWCDPTVPTGHIGQKCY